MEYKSCTANKKQQKPPRVLFSFSPPFSTFFLHCSSPHPLPLELSEQPFSNQPPIKQKCLLVPFTPCSHFPQTNNMDPVGPEAHLPRVALVQQGAPAPRPPLPAPRSASGLREGTKSPGGSVTEACLSQHAHSCQHLTSCHQSPFVSLLKPGESGRGKDTGLRETAWRV